MAIIIGTAHHQNTLRTFFKGLQDVAWHHTANAHHLDQFCQGVRRLVSQCAVPPAGKYDDRQRPSASVKFRIDHAIDPLGSEMVLVNGT